MQDRESGSLRLVNLMRLLRDEGAHVVFLPSDLKHAGAYTQALQALGIEAWHAPVAGGIPAWLREHGPRFDSVIACRQVQHATAATHTAATRDVDTTAHALLPSTARHTRSDERR